MIRIFFVLLCIVSVVWGETFVSTDVPVHIPDSPGGPARSHLTIPVHREILDVNITFTITHSWDGDLGIYLEAPNGDDVQLAYRCGGSQNSGNNFVNTTLDDEASTYVCDASPPYTDTFRPMHPLTAFDGLGTLGQWEFRVTDFAAGDTGSIQAWSLTLVLGDTITAAHDPFISHPSSLTLSVYPNPFNPVTLLAFSLAQPQAATLVVYDMTGRVVAQLANQVYPAGEHRVTFDGARLPSGIYFARLDAGGVVRALKMVLMR